MSLWSATSATHKRSGHTIQRRTQGMAYENMFLRELFITGRSAPLVAKISDGAILHVFGNVLKSLCFRCLGCVESKRGGCSGPPTCTLCLSRVVQCTCTLLKDCAKVKKSMSGCKDRQAGNAMAEWNERDL